MVHEKRESSKGWGSIGWRSVPLHTGTDEDTVKCCNPSCAIQEFHLFCLNINTIPKTWYCPRCRALLEFKKRGSKQHSANTKPKFTRHNTLQANTHTHTLTLTKTRPKLTHVTTNTRPKLTHVTTNTNQTVTHVTTHTKQTATRLNQQSNSHTCHNKKQPNSHTYHKKHQQNSH